MSIFAYLLTIALIGHGLTLAGDQPATTRATTSSSDETPTSRRAAGEDDESLEYIELTLTVLEADRRTADAVIAKSLPRGSSLPNLVTLAVTRKNDQYVDSMTDLAKKPGLSLFETRELVIRSHTHIQLEVGGTFLLPGSTPRSQEDSIPRLEPTFIGWRTRITPHILPGENEATRVQLGLVGQMRELRPHVGHDSPIREYDVRMAIEVPSDEFIVISNRSGDSALVLILKPRAVAGPLPPGTTLDEETTIRIDPAAGTPIDKETEEKPEEDSEEDSESDKLPRDIGEPGRKSESGLREELLRLRNHLDQLLKSPALRESSSANEKQGLPRDAKENAAD